MIMTNDNSMSETNADRMHREERQSESHCEHKSWVYVCIGL